MLSKQKADTRIKIDNEPTIDNIARNEKQQQQAKKGGLEADEKYNSLTLKRSKAFRISLKGKRSDQEEAFFDESSTAVNEQLEVRGLPAEDRLYSDDRFDNFAPKAEEKSENEADSNTLEYCRVVRNLFKEIHDSKQIESHIEHIAAEYTPPQPVDDQPAKMMKRMKRRLSAGDVSKENGNKERERKHSDASITKRSKSIDLGKKWFGKSPLFKRKNKNNFAISDAELVFSTYSGSPEPLDTLPRKKNLDLNDIAENHDEHMDKTDSATVEYKNSVNQKLGVVSEDIFKSQDQIDLKSEDMNALRDLLLSLTDENCNQVSTDHVLSFAIKEESLETLSPTQHNEFSDQKKIDSPNLKTPASTPQECPTPLPWQQKETTNIHSEQIKCQSEITRSSGFIDDELVKKLKAIERAARVSTDSLEVVSCKNSPAISKRKQLVVTEDIGIQKVSDVHCENIFKDLDKANDTTSAKDGCQETVNSFRKTSNTLQAEQNTKEIIRTSLIEERVLQDPQLECEFPLDEASDISEVNTNRRDTEQFDSVGKMRMTSIQFSDAELNRLENTINSLSHKNDRSADIRESLDEEYEGNLEDEFEIIDTPFEKCSFDIQNQDMLDEAVIIDTPVQKDQPFDLSCLINDDEENIYIEEMSLTEATPAYPTEHDDLVKRDSLLSEMNEFIDQMEINTLLDITPQKKNVKRNTTEIVVEVKPTSAVINKVTKPKKVGESFENQVASQVVRSELKYFIVKVANNEAVQDVHIDGHQTISLTIKKSDIVDEAQSDSSSLEDNTDVNEQHPNTVSMEPANVLVQFAEEKQIPTADSFANDYVIIEKQQNHYVQQLEVRNEFSMQSEEIIQAQYEFVSESQPSGSGVGTVDSEKEGGMRNREEQSTHQYEQKNRFNEDADLLQYKEVVQEEIMSKTQLQDNESTPLGSEIDHIENEETTSQGHEENEKVKSKEISDLLENLNEEDLQNLKNVGEHFTISDFALLLSTNVINEAYPALVQEFLRTAVTETNSHDVKMLNEDSSMDGDTNKDVPIEDHADIDVVKVKEEAQVECLPDSDGIPLKEAQIAPEADASEANTPTRMDDAKGAGYNSACHEINKTIDADISKREILIKRLLLKMAKSMSFQSEADDVATEEQKNESDVVRKEEKENDENEVAAHEEEEREYNYANEEARRVSRIASVIMKRYRSLDIPSDDEEENKGTADTETIHKDVNNAPRGPKRPPFGAVKVMFPSGGAKKRPVPLQRQIKPVPAARTLSNQKKSPVSPKPAPRPRSNTNQHQKVHEEQQEAMDVVVVESEVQFDWMENEIEEHERLLGEEKHRPKGRKFSMPGDNVVLHGGLLTYLEECQQDDGIQTKTPFFDAAPPKIKIKDTPIEQEHVYDVESEVDFSIFDEIDLANEQSKILPRSNERPSSTSQNLKTFSNGNVPTGAHAASTENKCLSNQEPEASSKAMNSVNLPDEPMRKKIKRRPRISIESDAKELSEKIRQSMSMTENSPSTKQKIKEDVSNSSATFHEEFTSTHQEKHTETDHSCMTATTVSYERHTERVGGHEKDSMSVLMTQTHVCTSTNSQESRDIIHDSVNAREIENNQFVKETCTETQAMSVEAEPSFDATQYDIVESDEQVDYNVEHDREESSGKESPLYIVSKDIAQQVNVSATSKVKDVSYEATKSPATKDAAQIKKAATVRIITPGSQRKNVVRLTSPTPSDDSEWHEPHCEHGSIYIRNDSEAPSQDIEYATILQDNTQSQQPASIDIVEAVTLEIREQKFVEQGNSQYYQTHGENSVSVVPVKLSSIQSKKPQNITIELRSSGMIPME